MFGWLYGLIRTRLTPLLSFLISCLPIRFCNGPQSDFFFFVFHTPSLAALL